MSNRAALDSIAMALLERETLDDHDVMLLAAGSPLPVLGTRSDGTSADRTTPVRPVEGAASG
jgi:hypothetical protein